MKISNTDEKKKTGVIKQQSNNNDWQQPNKNKNKKEKKRSGSGEFLEHSKWNDFWLQVLPKENCQSYNGEYATPKWGSEGIIISEEQIKPRKRDKWVLGRNKTKTRQVKRGNC